jgi:signal transduction histidine kinase
MLGGALCTGPPAARRGAFGLGLLALALLGLAPASAQVIAEGNDLPADHHAFTPLEPTIDLEFPPNLLDVQVAYNLPDPAGCQPASLARPEPDLGRFAFFENWTQAGCARFTFELDVPAGSEVFFRFQFSANRTITTAVEDVTDLRADIKMPQPIFLKGADESSKDFSVELEYFQEEEESRPRTAFDYEFLLPKGTARLNLTWQFQDASLGDSQEQLRFQLLAAQNPLSLSSTIEDLRFAFRGATLPVLAAEPMPERVAVRGTQEIGIIDYNLTVALPAELLEPDPRGVVPSARLRIPIADGPSLTSVVGPGGLMGSGDYVVTEGDGKTTVEVLPPALAREGPGAYTLSYQSVRVMPPPPPAEGETSRIYAFFVLMAALPAGGAALSIHQTRQYLRQAEGPYRPTALPVVVAVGLLCVYYVLLIGYSLLRVGFRPMTTMPLDGGAILVYVQLVALLFLLIGFALILSRTLLSTMRRDLDERARKEDQLRRSNEELERFAYVASHDLQEPLRKVAGFTALLQKKYGGRLDKDADEIIGYAVDGATRMQMLIKDILAYSKVGSKELNRVPVDLNALMEQVLADLGEPIRDSRARITWDELPTVRADASQLRQVLQNLVENAIKYRHPKRRPVVHVDASTDASSWHLEVRDNGIGIPADKHEEIFGLFRRLHGQDRPGTGIGLAVAKKAVERHGGRIWVESRPGKGSTFHLTLPRGLQLDPPRRAATVAMDAAPARGAAPS